MSISRVTSWSSGQVLTASALNDEFNNVINNALSLISPLTGNLAGGGNQITNTIFVPAALSGTPVQHALYQANVPKLWAVATTAATVYTLTDSFNVASLTDGGTGAFTLTIDRDFANTTYAVGGATTGIAFPGVSSVAVGSLGITVYDTGGSAADSNCHVIAIGDQ